MNIQDYSKSPFFADINMDNIAEPFKDTNVFIEGLTVHDLPPRPTRPLKCTQHKEITLRNQSPSDSP